MPFTVQPSEETGPLPDAHCNDQTALILSERIPSVRYHKLKKRS